MERPRADRCGPHGPHRLRNRGDRALPFRRGRRPQPGVYASRGFSSIHPHTSSGEPLWPPIQGRGPVVPLPALTEFRLLLLWRAVRLFDLRLWRTRTAHARRSGNGPLRWLYQQLFIAPDTVNGQRCLAGQRSDHEPRRPVGLVAGTRFTVGMSPGAASATIRAHLKRSPEGARRPSNPPEARLRAGEARARSGQNLRAPAFAAGPFLAASLARCRPAVSWAGLRSGAGAWGLRAGRASPGNMLRPGMGRPPLGRNASSYPPLGAALPRVNLLTEPALGEAVDSSSAFSRA